MNDLPNVVKNGKIFMYADDTNLSTKVNKVSDISDQLIPEFTNILNWLKENRLSLNFMKTKLMLIGSIQKVQPLNNLIAIRVNGRLLKRVKRIKYLGSVVDENLTWDDHINYISVKIRRNIGILKRMRLTVPRESLILLYKTLIEPYLDTVTLYGATVTRYSLINYRSYRIKQLGSLREVNLKTLISQSFSKNYVGFM